jgi:hypothetical protein
MKFGVFKTGKKEEGKENKPEKSAKVAQITDLEGQLKGRADSLKKTEAQLNKLTGKGKEDGDILATPHGPIAELSLEAEPDPAAADSPAAKVNLAEPEVLPNGIKIVEVKINPDAPAVAEKAKENEKPKDAKPNTNSFENLFAHDDEEENPLASLIRSLPNVETNELVDDLKEIKDIIKDWQKK